MLKPKEERQLMLISFILSWAFRAKCQELSPGMFSRSLYVLTYPFHAGETKAFIKIHYKAGQVIIDKR